MASDQLSIEMKGRLVLIRHGQSEANRTQTYVGWRDDDLTEKGIADAEKCGRLLKDANFEFDICYSSFLKRSIRTMWIITDILDQMWVPTCSTWRLNECHCGEFTGMKLRDIKKTLLSEHDSWRTIYDCPPPLLKPDDPRSPRHDRVYQEIVESLLPLGESLEMAWERLEPFWTAEIIPKVAAGKNVLVVSHGNIIRAMRKQLDGLTGAEAMAKKVIPNGFPIVYEMLDGKVTGSAILGDRSERKQLVASSQVI